GTLPDSKSFRFRLPRAQREAATRLDTQERPISLGTPPWAKSRSSLLVLYHKVVKRLPLLIFGILIVIIAIALWRDPLAQVAWQKYHSPQIAVLLDKRDAVLAMSIGNYYFNEVKGGGYNLGVAQKAYQK